MLYGLWIVMVFAIWPTTTHAIEGKSDPSAQEGLPAVQEWVFGTLAECPGSEPVCKAWINFRERHPWPYQGFTIAPGASDEDLVVIISEPPPIITRSEMIALVRNTFGSDLLDIGQFRWPTGLDGWLEDTVIRVRVDPRAERVPIIRGHTFLTSEGPAPIIDRLSYIHFVFHQTADGFYVDQLQSSVEGEEASRLQDIQISPADIQYWLSDDSLLWRSLDPDRPSDIQWNKLRLGGVSGVFADQGSNLVAFVVPKKSRLEGLAIPFRRFAVSTDLLLTAIQPKNGGMILIGRSRQVPFAVLPPLRFETFSSFAAYPTKEIYQSYERQRIFSGKILGGEHKGWDWAPIHLSAQLDNTEFGTLLNQADQILKSWSESGLVRYKTFDYPDPDNFPFDDEPASEYFTREIGSKSLIFNWNTHGFSTITELSMGNVLTANRSGSLPVLYIAGSALHEPPQTGRTRNEARFIKQLQKLVEMHQKQVESDTGDKAYQYFAEAQDPILLRVVQNVFLYQAVTNFLNLAKGTKDRSKEASTAKSEATSKAVRQEAERWLKTVAAKGTNLQGSPMAKVVNELLRRPGMTRHKLAEYLATPQIATRRLLQIEGERRKLTAQLEPLLDSYNRALLQSGDAFEEYCVAVKQNGGRRYSTQVQDPETGVETSGTVCEIKATHIPSRLRKNSSCVCERASSAALALDE